MSPTAPTDRPLAGRRIGTTREHRGALETRLVELGAEVEHVPLIEIVDQLETVTAAVLARNHGEAPDWLVVTSRPGARIMAGQLASGDSSSRSTRWESTRVAAVGSATAEEFTSVSSRSVAYVPEQQLATSLVEYFESQPPADIVVAQADRAATTLVDGLRAAGHRVEVIIAYSTALNTPAPTDVDRLMSCEVVVVMSGSAAESLRAVTAGPIPPLIAIGPSTARVAEELGLEVVGVAGEHSLGGVEEAVVGYFRRLGA
jgi:uroporphyrinogen-III synthase